MSTIKSFFTNQYVVAVLSVIVVCLFCYFALPFVIRIVGDIFAGIIVIGLIVAGFWLWIEAHLAEIKAEAASLATEAVSDVTSKVESAVATATTSLASDVEAKVQTTVTTSMETQAAVVAADVKNAVADAMATATTAQIAGAVAATQVKK